MGAATIEELIAWRLANEFKLEVYRLLKSSRSAATDERFVEQLRSSAASAAMNVAEGFYRFHRREFKRYLSIALASLGEAALWLRDGIDRGHFASQQCDHAFNLAKRCRVATLRLIQSLDDLPTEPTRAHRR